MVAVNLLKPLQGIIHFIAAQLAMCTFDVLQARAAGTQCTRCPKTFNVAQLAMRTFDVLHARTAGTERMQ